MKPYAVFTVVHNESLFLRLWCNYYCRLSPTVDVFVLDDSSSDSSLEDMKLRFPDVKVSQTKPGSRYDLIRLRESVQSFQESLLGRYEVVVYTDVDEFLLTSDHEGLFKFLERFRASEQNQARASGWHCVHKFGKEPPLALVEGQSVLQDRKGMCKLPRYDKVLVSKVPSRWTNGFHRCFGAEALKPDPNLVLFHAWMIDYDSFLQKQRSYVGDKHRLFMSHSVDRVSAGPTLGIPEEWKSLIHW